MLTLLSALLIHSSPLNTDALLAQEVLEKPANLLTLHFVFYGNKAAISSELKKITDPYVNKILTSNDLEEIEKKILTLYQQKGYPKTKIKSALKKSTLEISIFEGKKG